MLEIRNTSTLISYQPSHKMFCGYVVTSLKKFGAIICFDSTKIWQINQKMCLSQESSKYIVICLRVWHNIAK